MLPRLYELKNNTHSLDGNGYGFFSKLSKCYVTEEKNGEYYCELEIMPNDRLVNALAPGLIIKAKANHKDTPQLFEILKVQVAKNGVTTVTANHIKQYYFNNIIRPIIFQPYSYKYSGTAAEVVKKVSSSTRLLRPSTDDSGNSLLYQYVNVSGFDNTSKTLGLDFSQPLTLNDVFNSDGGIINTFGGEFHFDNSDIYFLKKRGSNTNKVIRYGSNISDYTQTLDNSEVYKLIYPYAKFSANDNYIVIEGTMAVTNASIEDYFYYKVLAKDFSDKFCAKKYNSGGTYDPMTPEGQEYIENRLTELAEKYVENHPHKLVEPKVNITVTYQPELDKLQNIGLCDTVKVIYGQLGMTHSAQVIKTIYDSLNERYVEMEIGEKKLYLNNFIKKSNRR